MVTNPSTITYAPDDDANDVNSVLIDSTAPQKNALAAIRTLVAFIKDLNLPEQQTAQSIATALASDPTALATLQNALEILADAFHERSNMGIPISFRDVADWVTAAAGDPVSALTSISAVSSSATFGPQWAVDGATSDQAVYSRHVFRPRAGRTYRVSVSGYAEASNSVDLQAIVARLDASHSIVTANISSSQAASFTAANSEQSVRFTLSIDNADADIGLASDIDFLRVGASIGPTAGTPTNVRLTSIIVEDVTGDGSTAVDIAAQFASNAAALESLKDAIVSDLDINDSTAIVADIIANVAALESLKDALIASYDATDAEAIAADLAASQAAMASLGAGFSGDIDAGAYAAGSIATADLGDSQVTSSKLAANAVTVPELGASLGQALPVPLDYTDTTLWTAEFGAGIVTGSAATTSAAERFIITFNGSSSDATQEIATTQLGSPEVATGQMVEVRAWFANTGSPVDGVRLGIQFKDENFGDVGGTALTSIAPADIDAGGGWVTVQAPAPVGARLVQIKIQRGGTNTVGTWFAGQARARLVDIPTQTEAETGAGTYARDWSEERIGQAIAARTSAQISKTVITSSAAAVDVPFSGYDIVVIRFSNLTPATDGDELRVLTSSDGGSIFDNGSNDYHYSGFQVRNASFNNGFGDASGAYAQLTSGGVGSGSGEGASGSIVLFSPGNAEETYAECSLMYCSTSSSIRYRAMVGFARKASADVDALRLLFETGNIASGTVVAYGYRS